jgi:hypothetical protein
LVSELSSGGSLISVWLRSGWGGVRTRWHLGQRTCLPSSSSPTDSFCPQGTVELQAHPATIAIATAERAEDQEDAADDADDLARLARGSAGRPAGGTRLRTWSPGTSRSGRAGRRTCSRGGDDQRREAAVADLLGARGNGGRRSRSCGRRAPRRSCCCRTCTSGPPWESSRRRTGKAASSPRRESSRRESSELLESPGPGSAVGVDGFGPGKGA